MAKGKCGRNSYYDGLVEMCKPCYLRCSNSPPVSCTSYCSRSSESPEPDNSNVWVILLVFLFLNAFTAVALLVHVLRKKRCRQLSCPSTDEGGCDATEQTDTAKDGGSSTWYPAPEEESSDSQYNSSLPLPSTEEGTTILVTTKTAQTYSYASHCTEDKTLGLWGSVCVT
uniref:BCMA TALL-1 binding domain-containing protein n=1 Tax=Scleropages formosus TaxID=113540 RepID=A0A8C9V3C1_SCLFO